MADIYSDLDWTDCELVERMPGKVPGRPIVRGTRILADTTVEDAELGSPLEEIHENYPDLPPPMMLRRQPGHSLEIKVSLSDPFIHRPGRQSHPQVTA
jgi:uncharacterized protein (DUF433 family)